MRGLGPTVNPWKPFFPGFNFGQGASQVPMPVCFCSKRIKFVVSFRFFITKKNILKVRMSRIGERRRFYHDDDGKLRLNCGVTQTKHFIHRSLTVACAQLSRSTRKCELLQITSNDYPSVHGILFILFHDLLITSLDFSNTINSMDCTYSISNYKTVKIPPMRTNL